MCHRVSLIRGSNRKTGVSSPFPIAECADINFNKEALYSIERRATEKFSCTQCKDESSRTNALDGKRMSCMKSKKLNPVVVSGMVGMMSLVFLFYVWGKVDLVRVGYELDVLSNKKAGLQREHDQLQLDLSRLTAPNRIAFEAGEKLGLTAPKPEQVVLVSVQGPDTPNRGEPGQEQFITIAQNLPERP